MQAKKLCQDFLRFVSILFLIFEKEHNQKNKPGCFKICKYTIFIIWKTKQAKIVLGLFKVCNYTLFNISKWRQAKNLC